MPKLTGQPTLTDERRKWDAKRLYIRYSWNPSPKGSVKTWREVFPYSKANDNSARIMWGREVRWFRGNFLEEMRAWEWSRCPDWMLKSSGVERPFRGRPPRGSTEREKRKIRQAERIIIAFCVWRLPLVKCWRFAVPESPASTNSARILAQRTANDYIRRHPGAAQLVLEDFVMNVSAMEAGSPRATRR